MEPEINQAHFGNPGIPVRKARGALSHTANCMNPRQVTVAAPEAAAGSPGRAQNRHQHHLLGAWLPFPLTVTAWGIPAGTDPSVSNGRI